MLQPSSPPSLASDLENLLNSSPPTISVEGSLPLLPEITHQIFGLLKFSDSTSLLAKLCRCSKSLCDELSPRLYKRIELDQRNAAKIAYGLDVPANCSARIKHALTLPPHPDDLLRLQTDKAPLAQLSPRERKLNLLGFTEEIDLRDPEGLLGMNRILARCQTVGWCSECSKIHYLLHSLSIITIRSPVTAALARAEFRPTPSTAELEEFAGAYDPESGIYMYHELYDMLESAITPKHAIIESHIWSLGPRELAAPPKQDRLLESGLEDVMGTITMEWEELESMEIRDLVGLEVLPDTTSEQCGVPDRALDRYTVHYASQDKLDAADPQIRDRLPRGPAGEVQLADGRRKHLKTLFDFHEDHEDLRFDDYLYQVETSKADVVEDSGDQGAGLGEHDGYKTVFEILNDPFTNGVDPDVWLRGVTENEELAAKMLGKVRFDIGGRGNRG
ncbi:hypothetical protein IAT40_004287 [Kwoniella sp. CBS 6097]